MQRDKRRVPGESGKSANDARQKSSRKADAEPVDDDVDDLSSFEGPVLAESMAELLNDVEVLGESNEEMSGLLAMQNPSEAGVAIEPKRAAPGNRTL
ncbi:MAG: hypothetical protein U0872_13025 [Planctomycetaceae bacterium]